ncbi:unnamed protein product [Prunus armeniaca]
MAVSADAAVVELLDSSNYVDWSVLTRKNDSKHTVNPRAPVWYRPKALRCLSKYGFEFRCGTLGVNRGAATCQSGRGCPNVVIGRSSTEGECRRQTQAWNSPRG